MPHRRGLGEDAASQLGENELGRLILKGQLEPLLGLAGEYFAGAYWGYVATLGGPARGGGDGERLDCHGLCGTGVRDFCMCAARRGKWRAAADALIGVGYRVYSEVEMVAVYGRPAIDVELLRVGLGVLAVHFGLTPRAKRITQMAGSVTLS